MIFRRVLLTSLLSISSLTAASPVCKGKNPVQNPSFETGTFAHWTTDTGFSPGTFSITTPGYKSAHAAQLSMRASHSLFTLANDLPAPLKSGVNYTLTFAVQQTSTGKATQLIARVGLSERELLASELGAGGGKWVVIRFPFTADGESDFVSFQCETASEKVATVLIDGVRILPSCA